MSKNPIEDSQVRGDLFIVAAPSGGGKTSLVKELSTTLPHIMISISHTTRAARPSEKEGVDYHFVTEPVFNAMIQANAFIEHAQVFGASYGTAASEIHNRLSMGIDVLLDIDWQGALQIKNRFPDAATIFILPPSLTILQERLTNRRQDEASVIAYRMQEAQKEMSHYEAFDYLIINDDFDCALKELQSIVIAKRVLRARQTAKYKKLLSLLLTSQ